MSKENKRKLIFAARKFGEEIIKHFGTEAENKLRTYSYKLINALGTSNRDVFLDTVTRFYSGINLEIPWVFFEVFNSDERFKEVGYAYVLGLKSSDSQNDNEPVVEN